MTKFDHFNLISPIYDLVFGKKTEAKIIQLMDLEEKHFLLDVGGGTGRITQQVLTKTQHAIIADSAIKMLREAQKKGISAVNTQSETLPFLDGAFDRIIMVDALHHVADQQRTIEEIWRSMAPGGRLVIEEPDINNWVVKLISLGEKLLLMRSQFLKPEEIIALCSFDDVDHLDLCIEKGIAWIIIKKRS